MTAARRSPRTLLLCAAILLAAACSGDPSDSETVADSTPTPTVAAPEPSPTPEPTAAPEPSPTATVVPSPTPEPELDIDAILRSDQLMLLNVLPPVEDTELGLPVGMADFDLVFSGDGDWDEVRDRLGFYRIHAWQVRYALTDQQLRTIFAYLDEHRIPLMFETEPLTYPENAGCVHTESFSGIYDLEMARRIRDLGGTVHAVAIEEPYHFVHKLDGPENCQWPVERIVDEVIAYMDVMRDLFPGVPVGTIEPIWASPATAPGDMEIWLDTWEERSGEPFAFLHLDPDPYRLDWPEVALGIEAVADTRDVPLGILYTGGAEPDGESWMQFAMENVALFEVERGGTPQHVSFQSWVDQPQRALPPDNLGALTSAITRYFGERTQIAVTAEAAGDGGVDLLAKVTTIDGDPVPGAALSVLMESRTGALGTNTVTGTVPDGAAEAVIVIRVNTEGAVPGQADFRVADISYREAGGPNLVNNGTFNGGTSGWAVRGSPLGRVRIDSAGGETWMAVSASADQVLFADSHFFPVSPGAEFEFDVLFGIEAESVQSVSVAVEFPGISRVRMDMTPPQAELVGEVTDAAGLARLTADHIEPGSYLAVVDFAGTLEYWPTSSSTELEIS